jgi:hypothetical protein
LYLLNDRVGSPDGLRRAERRRKGNEAGGHQSGFQDAR